MINVELHNFRCERCGIEFQSNSCVCKYCPTCRVKVKREQSKMWKREKRNESFAKPAVRHIEQPKLETHEKKKKHQANAALSEMSINDILKIAVKEHLNYGETVARLRDGRL